MDVICHLLSPLGELTLTSDGARLTGLGFAEQAQELSGTGPEVRPGEAPVFDLARGWLADYFAGRDPGPSPPLAPRGTVFQRRVWGVVSEIPRGETVTYGALAARLAEATGKAVSPRAVGAALGRNPILIMIPCHRVVGAGGKLVGYAGGVERKRALLEMERGGRSF